MWPFKHRHRWGYDKISKVGGYHREDICRCGLKRRVYEGMTWSDLIHARVAYGQYGLTKDEARHGSLEAGARIEYHRWVSEGRGHAHSEEGTV